MRRDLRLKATLRLIDEEGQRCFGPGVAALLEGVQEKKSLRAAAGSMGMAYSKAWRILRTAEEAFGCKLLDSTIGGRHGGGYFNLESGAPLGGHIRSDRATDICFLSLPFMGLESHSVQFFGADGAVLFGV